MTFEQPEEDDPTEPSETERRRLALPYIMPATLLLGLGVGAGLDAWQGSSPTWLVTCLLVSLAAGLYLLLREALR